jgi:hypothetical protein
LFLLALAGVALAGCVKNEVESPVTMDVKIGSHSYSGTSVNYSYPREESFRIFAVEHSGALTSWANATPTAFNNTAISYNGSLDAWAPLTAEGGFYYWPDNRLPSPIHPNISTDTGLICFGQKKEYLCQDMDRNGHEIYSCSYYSHGSLGGDLYYDNNTTTWTFINKYVTISGGVNSLRCVKDI